MKRVAIVKTFIRPKVFAQCVSALIAAGTQEVLVAFDGPSEYWEPHKKIVFEANQIIDAEIYRFPFDYGLAACRNRLIEMISEPYFLMVDDDIIVAGNIWAALPAISKIKNCCAATFGWMELGYNYNIDAWDIEIRENSIFSKTIRWPKKIVNINGFIFCFPFDFAPNQGFWSRKFFNEFQWDEHYIIEGEHEDLAMQIFPTKWRFAVCLNLFLSHLHDRSDEKYKNHRFAKEKWARSWYYFFNKWNLKEYRERPPLLPWISPLMFSRKETVRDTLERQAAVLAAHKRKQAISS